jgi:predicted nucleic acid-binding protein
MDMETSIADTGFVVALLNRSDAMHPEAQAVYLQQSQILLPQTALVEIAYLVGREAGVGTVAHFMQAMPTSRFEVIAANHSDLARIGQILEQYASIPIDFVDASIIAIAERLCLKTVLTFNHRSFNLFIPAHCPSFTLLP